MSYVTNFKICPETPDETYQAGQVIRGYVTLRVNKGPLNIRGIRINFKGHAKIRGKRGRPVRLDRRSRRKALHLEDYEGYFNFTMWLYGNGSAMCVFPGDYSFLFNFRLPKNIPHSFEGIDCYVRYDIKATLVRLKQFDIEVAAPIIVDGCLDLNKIDPKFREKGYQTAQTSVCCFCCGSGPISAVLQTNKQGFVPGEDIVINVEINNSSRKRVEESTLKLIQIFSYCVSKGNSSKRAFVRATLKEDFVVEAGETDVRRNLRLKVPWLPPSGLEHCNIIDVEYWLDLSVFPSEPNCSFMVRQPLIIGTIPFRDETPRFGDREFRDV